MIPGHWEGDLIKGAKNGSAVGTLVERTRRLVLLARMNGLDSATTCQAFARCFDAVQPALRQTLTYDRGTEMARRAELTAASGVTVYFADPYAPWQRGSAAATKTPTASSANICPKEPTSADTHKPNSTSSPNASTTDPAKFSTS